MTPLVELRQYTHHPGQRDVLIDLFESTFVEPQFAVGMDVLGQFRDLDDPNRFIWLRSFPDMAERARSLAAFYDGPVWQANRTAANATLIDSDNVLLLRPAHPNTMFDLDLDPPAHDPNDEFGPGVVGATVVHLDADADDAEVIAFFEQTIAPKVEHAQGQVLGYFVSERDPNTYPRLPVREGERAFAWFAGFADRVILEQAGLHGVNALLSGAPTSWRRRPPQALRLVPTAGSRLHGRSRGCLALAGSATTVGGSARR